MARMTKQQLIDSLVFHYVAMHDMNLRLLDKLADVAPDQAYAESVQRISRDMNTYHTANRAMWRAQGNIDLDKVKVD